MNRRTWCGRSAGRAASWAVCAWAALVGATHGATVELGVVTPIPYEVLQRQGYVPAAAHEHNPGGPQRGFADGELSLAAPQAPLPADVQWRWRVELLPGCEGTACDWQVWQPVLQEGRLRGTLRLPAGGWYRLQCAALNANGDCLAQASVQPIGVGEVFVVAGQSYASGANDELLRVADSAERVSSFDVASGSWRVAHDPQPDQGDGGTIWPPAGDALVAALRVPVGFVNVAVGGTASRQWLPGEALYERLASAGRRTGRFRAVLWQQGESDVIEQTQSAEYVARLEAIRTQLAGDLGFAPTWLLAKSTLHPTVYEEPTAETGIRAALDRLWRRPGFGPGPDTDLLSGTDRGALGTRRHFTGEGQRRAGALWAQSIVQFVQHGPASEIDAPAVALRTTSGGVRYALWGEARPQPAAVLFVFALGLEEMQTHLVYTECGRELARHGWLYVAVDPPCHGADVRPDEPPQLQGWAARMAQGQELLADVRTRATAVLDELLAQGLADPARIAACGVSRGGFLAGHWAAAEPRVRAVACFSPVTELAALREFEALQDDPRVAALDLRAHAAALADRGVWLSIGNDDERVSTQAALDFYAALRAAPRVAGRTSHPLELHVGQSAGHTMLRDAQRDAARWFMRQFDE